MIIVNAKITSKPGERDSIIEKAQDLIKSTRLEQSCICYDLYASTEDDNILMMFEKWKNQDALNSHMQTEHFKSFDTAIEELLAENIGISIYSVENFS